MEAYGDQAEATSNQSFCKSRVEQSRMHSGQQGMVQFAKSDRVTTSATTF